MPMALQPLMALQQQQVVRKTGADKGMCAHVQAHVFVRLCATWVYVQRGLSAGPYVVEPLHTRRYTYAA